MSRMISAPRYSIDLNISVVMIRQEASGLKLTSPVRRPTSYFPQKSLYFWLLIVLIGAVYTALVQCCKTSASEILRHEIISQSNLRYSTNLSPHNRQEALNINQGWIKKIVAKESYFRCQSKCILCNNSLSSRCVSCHKNRVSPFKIIDGLKLTQIRMKTSSAAKKSSQKTVKS